MAVALVGLEHGTGGDAGRSMALVGMHGPGALEMSTSCDTASPSPRKLTAGTS